MAAARLWRTMAVGAITMATAAGTGCGGGDAAAVRAPTIQVVTGLYPLAQAIAQIGGSKVAVTDVVPVGADPTTYRLSPAQIAKVRAAAVVVTVGRVQPWLDAAAAAAPHVLDLRAQLAPADPYVWLDPEVMRGAVALIAAALEAANPPAASLYREGSQAWANDVASTGIDYESTLSVCPRRTIVTPDGAFRGMAQRYGLTDEVVGTARNPDPATVAEAADRIRAASITTVFVEPFVATGTVAAVAAAAHVKVRVLDPLTGPPPGGWPHQADYLRLMEANLGALDAALGCPDTSIGP